MNMGPRIVRDGLYLCLDAALPQSNNQGFNLVDNGLGFSGNNYNFTAFTFDTVDEHNPSGSFKYSGGSYSATTNNFIAVNTGETYFMSCFAKAGETNGSGYYSQNRQYFGVASYDADFSLIIPRYCYKLNGSADTTLSTDLVSGDLVINLNNGSGWSSTTGVVNYNRQMQWWPYTNAKGYTYPNYTYTKNTTAEMNNNYYATSGCWSSRTGNVLYLTQPWPGPTLTSGTAVSNATDGGTYNYNVLSATSLTSGWVNYTGYIGNLNTSRIVSATEFRQGTEYVRLFWFRNYTSTPATPSDATVRYSDLIFRKISGNTFTDLTKNKNNGLLKNSVIYDGRSSPSYWFNGVDDWITFNNHPTFTNSEGTISIWIRPAALSNSMNVYYAATPSSLTVRLYRNNFWTVNDLSWLIYYLKTDATNAAILKQISYPLNTWSMATITFDNLGNHKHYVNGILNTSAQATSFSSWYLPNGTFSLGGPYSYYNGNISNFMIYNRVLSAAEILQNYNATKGRFGL